MPTTHLVSLLDNGKLYRWIMSKDDQDQPNVSSVNTSFTATIQFAVVGIQGLLAGNGGGITALLALKNGAELINYICPIFLFGVGFCSAILCSFFSYISQGYYTRRISGGSIDCHENGNKLRASAIFSGALSLFCIIIAGMMTICRMLL